MQVKITKSAFESYDITGAREDVIAVLEQLGFSPERYVTAHFKKKEVEPVEPDWQEIDQRDLRPGDIIRVMLDCNNEYHAERIVTAWPERSGRVLAEEIYSGTESPISSSDIYKSIQVDMEYRKPDPTRWQVINYDAIMGGDIVRVTGESDGTLFPDTVNGRDAQCRPQRTLIAHKEESIGWKDCEGRTVALRNQTYHKIERMIGR